MKSGKTIITNNNNDDFVASVDGISIALLNDEPVTTASKDWTKESKLLWAAIQIRFYELMVNRISRWRDAVEKLPK